MLVPQMYLSEEYLTQQGLSLTFPLRFISKVDFQGPDECWLWLGSVRWFKNKQQAHGQIWRGIRNPNGGWNGLIYAHVAAWLLWRGLIPDGQQVQHCCPGKHEPLCCNPKHLKLGNPSDNSQDMVAQGTAHVTKVSYPGELNGVSKLTWEKVREIRAMYSTGAYTQWDLAREHRVSQAVISKIVRHEMWIETGAGNPDTR